MTISSTTNRNTYTGNGTTADYAYLYKIFANTDLRVIVKDPDTDVETVITLTTHYTVSGVGTLAGGEISLVNGTFDWIDSSGFLKTGWTLVIRRVRSVLQETDIRNQGEFFPETHEDAFDHQIMVAQQLKDDLDRSFKLSEILDPDDYDTTLPLPVAGKGLVWNDNADALINSDLATTSTDYDGTISHGTDASKAASPGQGDIFIATDTKKIYRCFVAGTWSTAQVYGNEVNHAKGADIASATTTDIGAATGNFVHITGTVTITGLGTIQAGTIRIVRFADILTLTHNATSLILPGTANITTAANDIAVFVSEGSGNWRCVSYVKADGTAIAGNDTHEFLATVAIPQSNIALATDVQVVFGTEVFDNGGNFATNRFIAPVTGKYQISFSLRLGDIDQAVGVLYQFTINTSNRNYVFFFDPTKFSADLTGGYSVGASVLADMDASDTVQITFRQDNGSSQTDVLDGWFSGIKLA